MASTRRSATPEREENRDSQGRRESCPRTRSLGARLQRSRADGDSVGRASTACRCGTLMASGVGRNWLAGPASRSRGGGALTTRLLAGPAPRWALGALRSPTPGGSGACLRGVCVLRAAEQQSAKEANEQLLRLVFQEAAQAPRLFVGAVLAAQGVLAPAYLAEWGGAEGTRRDYICCNATAPPVVRGFPSTRSRSSRHTA